MGMGKPPPMTRRSSSDGRTRRPVVGRVAKEEAEGAIREEVEATKVAGATAEVARGGNSARVEAKAVAG